MVDSRKQLKRSIVQSVVLLVSLMVIIGSFFSVQTFAQHTQEQTVVQRALTEQEAGVVKFGLIAAAVAFGLGAIGAGIAIAYVGAAAMGAVAEKPEIAGQALIFVALAEGLVVFGFITALMILGKV